MLFTIDEAKIQEFLLTSDKPSYVVTPSYLVTTELPDFPSPPSFIGGTIFGVLPMASGAQQYVMSLRRKIEESGTGLKTADELEREIDEMRGRHR